MDDNVRTTREGLFNTAEAYRLWRRLYRLAVERGTITRRIAQNATESARR
jgi:hypothetical protein